MLLNGIEFMFIVVIFGSIGISASQEDNVRYKLLTNKKSWRDADTDCRSRDGTLLVIDNHSKVLKFQNAVSLEPGEAVWTAGYRQRSPWVWVEGCFSSKYLTKKEGVRVGKNQASECATLCGGTTYAALKGNICFCLDDVHHLKPLDSRDCDRSCPGSRWETCGGEMAVNLYSLGGVNGYKETVDNVASIPKQTVHEESRADWKNCVYLLKHNQPIWITTDCRKQMPFLCKIYENEGANMVYLSPRKKVGSWSESQQMCRDLGGTLADLHANNMEAVSALPDKKEFWVGLYRNTSWGWHTGNEELAPTWCSTVTEDHVGDLRFHTETCGLPHSYVCEIKRQTRLLHASNMVTYVVLGSMTWILAVITAIVVVCYIKKRACFRPRVNNDITAQIHTNYFDLQEENGTSRPTPRQHSYVNSDVRNQPTCSRPPPSDDSTLKPGTNRCQESSRYNATGGNEYASVTIATGKRDPDDKCDGMKTLGACGTTSSRLSRISSTSSDGDYDHVYDSLGKLGKKLKYINQSESKNSNSAENVYSEVANVTRVNLPLKPDNLATPSSLFPPMEEFRIEKQALGRTRSKSL